MRRLLAACAALLVVSSVARADALRQVDVFTHLGWNGPAGGGLGVSARITPRLSFDLTGGVAAIGAVGGVGARWNFSPGESTGFAALGYAHTWGGTVTLRGKTSHETVTTAPANLLPISIGYHTGYHGRLGVAVRTGWNFRLSGGAVTATTDVSRFLYEPGGFIACAELTVPLLPVDDPGRPFGGGFVPAAFDVFVPGTGQLWNGQPLKALVLVGGLVATSYGVSAVSRHDAAHPESRIPVFHASGALIGLGVLDAALYAAGIVDAFVSAT